MYEPLPKDYKPDTGHFKTHEYIGFPYPFPRLGYLRRILNERSINIALDMIRDGKIEEALEIDLWQLLKLTTGIYVEEYNRISKYVPNFPDEVQILNIFEGYLMAEFNIQHPHLVS